MTITRYALAAVCVTTLACSQPPRLAADLVITRASVWTGETTQPEANAIAVIGDRIVDVGSAGEIERWRGPDTIAIDAGGAAAIPGFNDAHVHFVDGGTQLDNVDLKDAGSPDEFARRIGERARAKPGEWIIGGDWDDQRWTPPQLPTRALVDAATNSSPVFVSRYDGHMALANSAALGRAGVTERTPDPPGGAIVRDANGMPTGVLKDAAMDFVTRVIPNKTPDQRLHAVKRAMEHAASLGVTSVQDMNPSYDDIAVYADLANRRELTVRYAAPWNRLVRSGELGITARVGSPWFRVGAVKATPTAPWIDDRSFQPYADARARGLLSEEMQPVTNENTPDGCGRGGAPALHHAIGDAGISQILDRQRRRSSEWRPGPPVAHRTHNTIAPTDSIALHAEMIASVQPYHAIDDGRWAERRIGPERIKTTYAFRTLLDKGVRVAFGTDWSVAPLNPMLSLYAATTRATLDGKNPNGWVPEQKTSIAEAVTAYTRGSAFAEFQEAEKGTIARGKLADLVIPLTTSSRFRSEHQRRGVLRQSSGEVVYRRSP
jgi:predicted amidohydrolase YtcJ